jgi:hypothetical protein
VNRVRSGWKPEPLDLATCRAPISDLHRGDKAQPRKFLMRDSVQEGENVRLPASEVRRGVLQEPGLLGEGLWTKELEDELTDERLVVADLELVWGEGEAEVGLWEGGDRTT